MKQWWEKQSVCNLKDTLKLKWSQAVLDHSLQKDQISKHLAVYLQCNTLKIFIGSFMLKKRDQDLLIQPIGHAHFTNTISANNGKSC